ncbi:MAG: hypothetical protein R3242_09780 [Akkermansiaceae bacterium]|nr:hypothetical protein [Akkermansiaceae bacterium]
MKASIILPLIAFALLPSCGSEKGETMEEVVVTETRRETMRDMPPRLHATSDERFRNSRSSPVSAPTPDGWLQVPATEFRLLNYRFGDEGAGEVWVSLAGGGLVENLNRWLGQFSLDPVDADTLETWGKVPVGDYEGIWVEASGTYSPGMGQAPRGEQALAGVIVEGEDGLLTIKMVGPIPDVQAQKDALKEFAASLEWKQP